MTKEEVIKRRMRDLTRWRYPWNSTPDSRRTRLAFERLRAAGKMLERKHGDNFVGILVTGSRLRGYARRPSDLDYLLFFKNRTAELEKNSPREAHRAILSTGIAPGPHPLHFLEDIAAEPANPERISEISHIFAGAWASSPRVEDARREILEILSNRSDGQKIWKQASAKTAAKAAEMKRPPQHLTPAQAETVRLARSRMVLPAFSELSRAYLGKGSGKAWVQTRKSPAVFALRRVRQKQ